MVFFNLMICKPHEQLRCSPYFPVTQRLIFDCIAYAINALIRPSEKQNVASHMAIAGAKNPFRYWKQRTHRRGFVNVCTTGEYFKFSYFFQIYILAIYEFKD